MKDAKRDYGSFFIDDDELEQVLDVLEQKAAEMGGHCLVFEDFACARCGCDDGRLGLDLHVPPEIGARFPKGAGRPLVMINVRLCEDCIRWTATDEKHETQLALKVLEGLVWNTVEECDNEMTCGIVTPEFRSLLYG